MARIDDLLSAALRSLPEKPSDSARRPEKKRYSERVSQMVAQASADELRQRGLKGSRPAPPGELGKSGAERRMAGGIGAKKVDVTWATEESGLRLGISIKSINFRDRRTGNFQKNLTNRRGDMLFEAVTLHRRFPYAVLGGLFFLAMEAAEDATKRRRSTFLNAHGRMRPILAIATNASGEFSMDAEAHEQMVWSRPRDGIYMQTPLVYGDLLYCCANNGGLAVYDARTGDRHNRQRLGTGATGFAASAVAGDGKIFFTSEYGEVYVVEAGPDLKVLAVNELGETCMATPAISSGALFFRTRGHLVAVAESR